MLLFICKKFPTLPLTFLIIIFLNGSTLQVNHPFLIIGKKQHYLYVKIT